MSGQTVLVVHERYQQPGGEDVAVEADLALLEAHGHRVVYHERHNDELDVLGRAGRARTAAGAVWSVRSTRSIAELIDRVRPDVMHVHNTFPLLSPAIYRAAARRAVPVVQTVQNYRMVCAVATCLRKGEVCHECLGRRLPIPALRYACYHDSRLQTAVVATMQITHRLAGTWDRDVSLFLPASDAVLRRLVSAGAFAEQRAMVRRNHIAPDPGRRDRGIVGDNVVFVGRLAAEKGVDVLIRAASLAPATPVTIVGDGPEMASSRRLASELGATNVTFTGRVPRAEAMDIVRRARCLAFPSTWEEPMSLVLLEALAMGVPVVGSDIGGVPEAVPPDVGVLVPAGDAGALARSLIDAAEHPEPWWQRGLAARRHYEAEFTAERAYETLVAAYHRVGVALDDRGAT